MKTPATLRRAAALALVISGSSTWIHAAVAAPEVRGDATSPAGRLQTIVAQLAERWDARIVVDPEIVPSVPPKTPDADLPLEPALRVVCASLRGVAWRRVYLPRGATDAQPAPETLAATARVLDALDPGTLLVQDPGTRRGITCLKDEPVSPALLGRPWAGRFQATPVYLLYATVVGEEKQREERLADLQRQQLALPARAEQMAGSYTQTLQLMQAVPAATLEEFAGRSLRSAIQLWETTPATVRQEMMADSLRLLQHAGAAPQGGPGLPTGSHPSRSVVPPGNGFAGSLHALAAAIGARHDVTLVVDPALSVAAPPREPDGDLSLEKALDALVVPLAGAAWRRVYLPEAQIKGLKRSSAAARLAATVRELERLEPGSMVLEDGVTGRVTTYRKGEPAEAREPDAGTFSARPIYLLYSTAPSARGDTPEERFADLQRQQMALMFQMEPAGIGRSMEQIIRRYGETDAATRTRLMGLPMAATMMALWFPREAKERHADVR